MTEQTDYVARSRAARERIASLIAEIEALACILPIDEMCAIQTAGGTIRAAALGYVMRLVPTGSKRQ
jgi:hypothetical protein